MIVCFARLTQSPGRLRGDLQDTEHHTRCAQLGMTQPTVSNAFARLRVQLGDQLFTRLDRGVAPTTFAENIIHPVRHALSVLRTGLQPQTSFDYGNTKRVFRIAMHSFAVHVLLPTLLDELIESAPGIRLDILTPDWVKPFDAILSVRSISVSTDFACRTAGAFEPLFDVQPVAIVRKGHPIIDGFLSRETFSAVGHVFLGMPVRRVFQMEQALVLAGLNRRIVCELSNGSDLAQMVSRTNLVALVPLRYAMSVGEIVQFAGAATAIPISTTQKFIQAWHAEKEDDIGLAWLRSRIRQAAAATDVPLLPPHPEWTERQELQSG